MRDIDILLSPAEVCQQLKVKDSTLRKYVSILEAAGYSFSKNNRGHRQYKEKDVIALRKFIAASERTDMTLETAAEQLVSMYKQNNTTVTVTQNVPIQDQHSNDIAELKQTVNKQSELIALLVKRLEEKDRYEKQRDDHFNKLLEQISSALEQNADKVLELAAAKEEIQTVKSEWEAQKQKGFFARLFGK